MEFDFELRPYAELDLRYFRALAEKNNSQCY